MNKDKCLYTAIIYSIAVISTLSCSSTKKLSKENDDWKRDITIESFYNP